MEDVPEPPPIELPEERDDLPHHGEEHSRLLRSDVRPYGVTLADAKLICNQAVTAATTSKAGDLPYPPTTSQSASDARGRAPANRTYLSKSWFF